MTAAKRLLVPTLIFFSGWATACSTEYSIQLETFGEGVLVELRSGTPGNSRVVRSARSTGGTVRFSPLCPNSYFLAIGNDDSVSVTQTRYFEDGASYSSRITVQRGSGNVSTKSRKSL